MKRVYALYRVSTKGQVDKNDIPMQKNACRTFVDKMDDWQLCKEFYEKGVSGFKVSADKRDAIQDLKLAAENNEFDILLVFMFDRLGRIPNETPFVLEWFDSHNIEIWSVKEGQQRFENDGDYLMNYIRFWQAGGESKKTSIRVKERLSQLVEEGAFTGGCCPYGYRFIKSGVVNKKGKELVALEIVSEEAALISFIFNKTVKEGYGTWRLCKIINEKGYRTHNGAKFQSNTVNRILKNYVYAGYFLRNGKLSPHIPQLQIVDKQLIDQAQIILKSRSNNMNERNNIAYTTRGAALLSGNIYCAHCGTRMHAITYSNPVILADGTRKVYKGIKYICPNRARNRGDCDGQTQYSSTEIDKTVLDLVDEVLNCIKGKPKDKAIKIKYNKTVEQKKIEYNKVIKSYEKQQEIVKKLLEEVGKVLINESTFDINTLNESLKMQKERLADLEQRIPTTLQELNNEKEMLENIDYLYDEFVSWSGEFNLATKERKKMIICKLFKSIKIGKGYNVEITLNLDYEQFLNGITKEESIAI